MVGKDKAALREANPYSAGITHEQFLFYEMKTTEKLVCETHNNEEIVDRIVKERAAEEDFLKAKQRAEVREKRICIQHRQRRGGTR